MADNTTYYGDISPRTAAYAAKRLLMRGKYIIVTEKFGQIRPLPKKSSKTVKFRRYEDMTISTTPLSEGQTPDGQKLTYTDALAVLQQYGDYVEITDVIQDTHEDPVLNEAVDLCGEQAAYTLEKVRFLTLRAGASVYRAGYVSARTSVVDFITRGILRKVTRTMKSNRAKFFTKIVKAGPNIATEPIGPCFWAVGHTDSEADLRDLPGFVPVEKYSDSDRSIEGEVGKVENTRFVLTALCDPFEDAGGGAATKIATTTAATACDVYYFLIIAPDAYGVVPLKGKNAVTPKVLNPEKPTKSDPLGQRGFVSWKTYHAAVILQENWIYRLEHACTDNPT
jgi:N4-gp56 family major capsid protein